MTHHKLQQKRFHLYAIWNSLSKCYATRTEVTALILAMDHALCIATDPAIGITRRANPEGSYLANFDINSSSK